VTVPFVSAEESRRAAESRYDLAVDDLALGRFDDAVSGFQAALAADPSYADAAHGLMHALKNAGRIDEAVEVARALVAADPDDTLAHTGLSILYQHQGRIPEAEAAATRAKVLGWKHQLRQQSGNEDGK
jgi:tetratricopeptide (TPR) repeat protein